jgi:hypothetical protein
VAEKRVYVVSLGQNVSSPAVQHGQLQEGCKVFRFVFQKHVPRRFLEQAIVAIRLTQLVIQMPVLATRPNTPLGYEKQCWPVIRQFGGDPVSKKENSIVFGRVFDAFNGKIGRPVRLPSLSVG